MYAQIFIVVFGLLLMHVVMPSSVYASTDILKVLYANGKPNYAKMVAALEHFPIGTPFDKVLKELGKPQDSVNIDDSINTIYYWTVDNSISFTVNEVEGLVNDCSFEVFAKNIVIEKDLEDLLTKTYGDSIKDDNPEYNNHRTYRIFDRNSMFIVSYVDDPENDLKVSFGLSLRSFSLGERDHIDIFDLKWGTSLKESCDRMEELGFEYDGNSVEFTRDGKTSTRTIGAIYSGYVHNAKADVFLHVNNDMLYRAELLFTDTQKKNDIAVKEIENTFSRDYGDAEIEEGGTKFWQCSMDSYARRTIGKPHFSFCSGYLYEFLEY